MATKVAIFKACFYSGRFTGSSEPSDVAGKLSVGIGPISQKGDRPQEGRVTGLA